MPVDARKKAYFETLGKLLDENCMILVVNADNVKASQLQRIRLQLRGYATCLMGKNTMMRKAMRQRNDPNLDPLIQLLVNNVGLLFVHKDVAKVRDVIAKNLVGAPAKAGAVAPIDVTVPAGNTGMDPNQTNFFQVLNIPTKINKGTVEIVSDVALIKKGEKVGASQAALLQKLNIRPFSYGLNIENVFEEGSVYSLDVLDINEDDLLSRLQAGVNQFTSVALAIGYPCKATYGAILGNVVATADKLTKIALAIGLPNKQTAPHFVRNAFQNLLAIAVTADVDFKQAKDIKAYLKDPSKFAAAPAAAAPAAAAPADAKKKEEKKEAAPKKEEKKEEPPPEEDTDMGFGLFD